MTLKHSLILLNIIVIVLSDNKHKSSFQSAEEAEKHLHQDQIPPPYKQPSHDDIIKVLTDIFTSDIDKDKDSFATVAELKNWLEIVHEKLIKDNVEEQWQYFHPDVQEVHSWEGYKPEQKAVLDWQKYVNATYPEDIHEPDTGDDPQLKNMKLMYKRAERRWKLADSNGDTVLTLQEFKDFVHPEESERTRQVLVDEAKEDMDTDKNGDISLEEYMNHLTEVATEEEQDEPDWTKVQQNQFTTYLDKNKDGVLNNEELKEWLVPNESERHESEAKRLIEIGDDNQDSKLAKDELLKYSDQYLSIIPPEFWNKFSDVTTPDPYLHDEF